MVYQFGGFGLCEMLDTKNLNVKLSTKRKLIRKLDYNTLNFSLKTKKNKKNCVTY